MLKNTEMIVRSFFLIILTLFISCARKETPLTAQQIIDKTILRSGADKVESSQITFQFRDKSYKATRKKGAYVLDRTFKNDSSIIKDAISNKGFMRFVNHLPFAILDTMATRYSNAVNSVHYFSVLPFGLNDNAVQKKQLPSSIVKGKAYYKIEISFSEDGGGEDFEDVFVYWIGKEDFLIDYLAYSYHTNGGGKRFRVLKEQCNKNGIRFVDYHNYKPLKTDIALIDLDISFEKKQLKKVSEIILENIEVTLLTE
jgi:hypothetical protein